MDKKINALELLEDALLLDLVGQKEEAVDLVKQLSQIPAVRKALESTDLSRNKAALEIGLTHKETIETIKLRMLPNEDWLL